MNWLRNILRNAETILRLPKKKVEQRAKNVFHIEEQICGRTFLLIAGRHLPKIV